ncbi:hypothetical protein [Pseudidiomarina mangrovi]|uniref:hypothetical protein n=1 Tax=Pseudidiomarina mangrovi TaxID=2487133 RepID=UPI000FCB9F8C|nr:hypothetical protein [Pseudidiomarina mangrovi]
MKIYLILIFFIFSASCKADDDKLKQCGIAIEKTFYDVRHKIVEFTVTIDSEKARVSCGKIYMVSIVNYMDDEWVIFPWSKDQADMLLRLRRDNAEDSIISFVYEVDGQQLIGDDSNRINVRLERFFD